MNLLSPDQAHTQKTLQENALKMKGAKLASLVGEEEKKLAETKARVAQEAQAIETETAQRIAALQEEEKSLKESVQILQTQRAEAMLPVEDLLKSARQNEIRTQQELLAVLEERSALELERVALDANGELMRRRDASLSKRERQMLTRETELHKQETTSDTRAEDLTKEWASLQEERETYQTEKAEAEDLFKQREAAIEVKRLENIAYKQELDQFKLTLKDERATLQSAWDELERKLKQNG